MDITDIVHPIYASLIGEWRKWRLTYEGGQRFIDKYLTRLRSKEDAKEFSDRKAVAYCPAFAKTYVQEVRNSIYRRMVDVVRVGGSPSYQNAIRGQRNGVDLLGSTMNYFMGVKALDELLVMGRVGIYVDAPVDMGTTLLEQRTRNPYIYLYCAEDIKSYRYDDSERPGEFAAVLLEEHTYGDFNKFGLPCEEVKRFRLLQTALVPQGPGGSLVQRVFVKFFNQKNERCTADGIVIDDDELGEQISDIDRIPFTLLTIPTSLLADVANYQIAHMNLASSDIWYAIKANFPIYVEQFDPRSESPYIRKNDSFDSDPASTLSADTNNQILVGPARGRRYPVGTERPGFIAPSAEPMKVSMLKQAQLKEEIRQLVHLSLASLSPSDSSAESKTLDNQALEDGLSYLALILQHGENRVAEFWAMYEGGSPAEIKYPDKYNLLTADQIQREIKTLEELAEHSTSPTLKRQAMKIITGLKIARYCKRSDLAKINNEIDDMPLPFIDPKHLTDDIVSGIVSLDMASTLRGYPDGEADRAAEDHAARLARIQLYQSPRGPNGGINPETAQARGLTDQAANLRASKDEKLAAKEQAGKDVPRDPVRGEQTSSIPETRVHERTKD